MGSPEDMIILIRDLASVMVSGAEPSYRQTWTSLADPLATARWFLPVPVRVRTGERECGYQSLTWCPMPRGDVPSIEGRRERRGVHADHLVRCWRDMAPKISREGCYVRVAGSVALPNSNQRVIQTHQFCITRGNSRGCSGVLCGTHATSRMQSTWRPDAAKRIRSQIVRHGSLRCALGSGWTFYFGGDLDSTYPWLRLERLTTLIF